MYEIEKLRRRLKNVNKGTIEYRMSVTEANALLKEIDTILQKEDLPIKVDVNEPAVITRIMDGGVL